MRVLPIYRHAVATAISAGNRQALRALREQLATGTWHGLDLHGAEDLVGEIDAAIDALGPTVEHACTRHPEDCDTDGCPAHDRRSPAKIAADRAAWQADEDRHVEAIERALARVGGPEDDRLAGGWS